MSFIEWCMGLVSSKKELKQLSNNRSEAIERAIDVIEQHQMKAHLYIAGIDHRENEELGQALDVLGASGFIITDRDGLLVGKVVTKRLNSDELAKMRRGMFKLIE